jgi:hypothetical protein
MREKSKEWFIEVVNPAEAVSVEGSSSTDEAKANPFA